MIRILLIRPDTLTCSLQDDTWGRAAKRALDQYDSQQRLVDEGVPGAVPYVRIFGHNTEEGGLDVLSLRALRDLAD